MILFVIHSYKWINWDSVLNLMMSTYIHMHSHIYTHLFFQAEISFYKFINVVPTAKVFLFLCLLWINRPKWSPLKMVEVIWKMVRWREKDKNQQGVARLLEYTIRAYYLGLRIAFPPAAWYWSTSMYSPAMILMLGYHWCCIR